MGIFKKNRYDFWVKNLGKKSLKNRYDLWTKKSKKNLSLRIHW